ncbi:MAG: hypothetical protein ISQ92_02930 [Pelagibacteraceae bacterium]|jgi:hypothetical protein|nr:hypothetical protein [Pelagibacteraceae bacterium]
MKEITQIRSLSIWIFFVPFLTVNTCLFISTNFHLFENTFFSVDQIGRSYGFPFPYFDGSLSISRASRTFPQFLIFKPGIIITSFLLCFYWYKNNLLINLLKNTEAKRNAFMIFGILSAIFLIIHALLLGVETEIKIFKFLRRVVLVSFIIFEIAAQTMLVIHFYKLKEKLNNLSNPLILKLKIILVSILIFVALISIPVLISSGSIHFKHGLEWNYFIGVILFYLLTNFFWKKPINNY